MCRAAAIQAGAVPALCSILQAGAARAVPVALDDVLRALYALAAADASGHSASELFASGGIHSLVRGRSDMLPTFVIWTFEADEAALTVLHIIHMRYIKLWS